MNLERLALVNIGGNDSERSCGRGPIFFDGTFKYIPIPEKEEKLKDVTFRFPKYSDLGIENYVKDEFKRSYVHIDPNFHEMTYGHAKRGFGYETILKNLNRGDILAFYATLDYFDKEKRPKYDWINKTWGTYIIGAFTISGVYSQKNFLKLPYEQRSQFVSNPHFLRKNHGAYFWIAGHRNSPGLFDIAFPLDDEGNRPNDFLKKYFTTSGGNEPSETGYYRSAFICEKNVWKQIERHSIMKFS